jgi:hypothetical protein
LRRTAPESLEGRSLIRERDPANRVKVNVVLTQAGHHAWHHAWHHA